MKRVERVFPLCSHRYVHYLTGMLSGGIRINNNPIYLQQIIVRGLPEYEDKAARCQIFVKIYQNMQPVYVSGIWYLLTSFIIMVNIIHNISNVNSCKFTDSIVPSQCLLTLINIIRQTDK